jgi:hypothetical protein
MAIKRLVAREFTVTEDQLQPGKRMEPGDKYTYLEDPETGKFYRPIDGWEVAATGDTDLASMFVEV